MEKETPNYFAILPAPVRYAEDLSEFQKLLYAEITALSQKDGYCYASNTYFSTLYKKRADRISRCIKNMESLWYIRTEYNKNEWNRRKIYVEHLTTNQPPIGEKYNTIVLKHNPPIEEKHDTLLEKSTNIIIQDNKTRKKSSAVPTTTSTNQEFIDWMKLIETNWQSYLEIRKTLTGTPAFMSQDIKKCLYSLQNSLTLDQFKSNVERFTAIKSLILKKQMQNYFYYPIWSRTLENFLTHINKFFWDDATIITRLAKKESLKKALRVLEIKPEFLPQPTQPTQKKQITEKEKQECIAILKAAKERLLQHTIT